MALDAAGRVIVAKMSACSISGRARSSGSIRERGTVETLVAALEERTLVASNFPTVARDGTIYCTHTSWGPVANIGNRVAAGFIYMVAPDGAARIVARELRG